MNKFSYLLFKKKEENLNEKYLKRKPHYGVYFSLFSCFSTILLCNRSNTVVDNLYSVHHLHFHKPKIFFFHLYIYN